jgi:hypothetical protein
VHKEIHGHVFDVLQSRKHAHEFLLANAAVMIPIQRVKQSLRIAVHARPLEVWFILQPIVQLLHLDESRCISVKRFENRLTKETPLLFLLFSLYFQATLSPFFDLCSTFSLPSSRLSFMLLVVLVACPTVHVRLVRLVRGDSSLGAGTRSVVWRLVLFDYVNNRA